MDLPSHSRASKDILGRDCQAVHIWIDACFPDYMLGGKNEHYGAVHYHHIERHHKQALAEKYGKNSFEYKVGCLHILVDMISHYGIAVVPENEDECLTIIDEYFGR